MDAHPDASTHIPPSASGSYPVRGGNLVRLLVGGVSTFRRIAESIESARHSVWLTVAFYDDDFRFPDGRGSLFDVLDQAAERGLDVRILFWRPNPESSRYGRTFAGTETDRDQLSARGLRFNARWDRAHAKFVHHQKSWLIDAGHPSETAFVGGTNLTAVAMTRHDIFIEVVGPSATDVHHNFVQRWNEASECGLPDGLWGKGGAEELPFPTRVANERGESTVQIQRMVAAGQYRNGHATPGGGRHDITAGERSILEQYENSIESARTSIYIENQAIPIAAISGRLENALQRGVDVILLAPADPERHVREARKYGTHMDLFDRLEALGQYANFTLAGIAASHGDGTRRNVYVHAKIMIVDRAWATIGSCNLHSYSLSGHTEMNVSVWDAAVVRALRRELFSEHLGCETAHLDDRAAFQLYRQIARNNRLKRAAQDLAWQGNAFELDPTTYGLDS